MIVGINGPFSLENIFYFNERSPRPISLLQDYHDTAP